MNTGLEIFKRMQRLQGGSEAVPSELPSPPEEELVMKPNSLSNLRPAMLLKGLGDELSGLSKEDIAKMVVAGVLTGGEAEPIRGGAAMDVGALQAQLKALRKQESEFLTVSRGSRRMIKSEENRLAIQKVRQQLKEAGAPDLTLAEKRKLRAGQTEAGTSGSVEAVDFAPGDFVETPHGTGKVRQVHSDHLQVLMDEHEPGYPLRSIPKSDVKKFLNEATKTESDALPTVPTGETGTGITEEPPRGYVRGTKIVRGYPPTHMLNNC